MKALKIISFVLIIFMLACIVLADGQFITSIYYHDKPERDYVDFYWNVRNSGDRRMEDVQVKVTMPELGEYYSTHSFDLGTNEYESGFVYFDMPRRVPPGEYVVRYTVSNDEYSRTKYRFVYID